MFSDYAYEIFDIKILIRNFRQYIKK